MSNRSNVAHPMFGWGLFVVAVPGMLVPGGAFHEFGYEVYGDPTWNTSNLAEEWAMSLGLHHAYTVPLTSPTSLDPQVQWPPFGTPEEPQVILIPRRNPEGLQVVGVLPSREFAMTWRKEFFHDYPVGSYSKPLPLLPIEQYAANVEARRNAVDALSLVGERNVFKAPEGSLSTYLQNR